MNRVISFIGAFVIVGALATSGLAIPLDGSSVSISGAQFKFNATGSVDEFTTAPGSDTVIASFFDPLGDLVVTYSNAKLVVTAVDFTGGLLNGTDGGFSITDNSTSTVLLSGTFGSESSLTSGAGGADFEASVIVSFIDPSIVGTAYNAPGLFSATLGNIGTLSLDTSWTSNGAASATILSSVSVSEPTTLLLLGSGLVGLALWGRRRGKASN